MTAQRVLIALCLASALVAAQSAPPAPQTPPPSQSQPSTPPGQPPSQTPGQIIDPLVQNADQSATPDPNGEFQSQQQQYRPLSAGDVLAPLSRMRWGPFAVYGGETTFMYSNQPLTRGLGAALGSGFDSVGFGDPSLGFGLSGRRTVAMRGGASMGGSWRIGRGWAGFRYNPMFDYQSDSDYHQLNHVLSLFVDRQFQLGEWRLSFGVNGGTLNQLSALFQQTPLEPVVALQVPITNQDIFNLLIEPKAFELPTQELVMYDRRFFAGSGMLSLSRRLSPRDDLSIDFRANLRRTMIEEAVLSGNNLRGGGLYNTSGGGVSIAWRHRLSSRTNIGVQLNDNRNIGGLNRGSQQSVSLEFTTRPAPRWALRLSGGPSVSRFTGESSGARTGVVYAGSISRAGNSTVVAFNFNRGFYFGALPMSSQTDQLNFEWQPQMRGKRWRYSVASGYQWLHGPRGGLMAHGWMVRPAFSYPISRNLMFFSQYVFFQQNFSTTLVSSGFSAPEFGRHMVVFGFRYSFGGQGERY
jgi:hypothetical protein